MNFLLLIPWPQTGWSEAGRIASRTPLPLSEAGSNQAHLWADGLANAGLDVVYSSKERVSIETARIVAEHTGAKHKTVPEFAEVDAGLWDGLTAEELKRLYPKVFKKWHDDPASIRPPKGEDVVEAFERLQGPFERITRKQSARSMGLVLGPVAFGLVRCMVESLEPSGVRGMMHDAPLRYELDGESRPVGPTAVVSAAP